MPEDKSLSFEDARRRLLQSLSGAPRKPAKRATRSANTAKPDTAGKAVVRRAATAPLRRIAK